MIWRFLVRRFQCCALPLKRLLVSVLVLTAAGTATAPQAQAIAKDSSQPIATIKQDVADLGDISFKVQGITLPVSKLSTEKETRPKTVAIAPAETLDHSIAADSGLSPLPADDPSLQALEALETLEFTFEAEEIEALALVPETESMPVEVVIAPTQALTDIPPVELAQQPNSNTEPLPEVQPLPADPSPAQTIEEPDPTLLPEVTDIDGTVAASNIQVTGSTVFDEADFAPILAELSSPEPTSEELSRAANQITALYLAQGYITSRAVVAVEEAPDGDVVTLQVIEGKVDNIEITGNRHLSESYLLSRLRLGAKTPLNTGNLEDQLRLLQLSPSIDNIEATLKAGDGIGESDLDITVTEADTISLNIGTDNFSPASVGAERITADFVQQNLTGSADRLGVGYIRTTQGGADSLDINYNRPINAQDGSIGLRAVFSSNEVIQAPFDVLNIRGESDRYEISYRQPLIRNPREELAFGLSLTYQDGLTFLGDELFGFNAGTEDGTSTTTIVKFSQDYIKRQSTGAWSLRSQFSFGTEWFDATQNDGDTPDGQFWSWLGQIQRVRLLNPNNLLVIQADIQLTPDTLLPSQQFVIGGGQSLRGYRQNARSADNGVRFSIEDRITLARDEAGDAVFQLAPFFDMGTVWNNDNNPNTLPDQTFLAGLGMGVWWQMEKGLTLRFDYALPLVDLSDRSDDMQDDGLYFDINYLF